MSKIEIKVDHNEFETTSPMKAFTFLTALLDFDFSEEYAREVVELVSLILAEGVDWDIGVNVQDLIYAVCENYFELPDDFNEILKVLSVEFKALEVNQ